MIPAPAYSPPDELAETLEKATNVDLLKLMAQRENDEDWADAAWCEFFNRHKEYMWTVCSEVAEGLNGDAWVEDMFQQMFARAYELSGTFKIPPGAETADEAKLVRGWLGKIALDTLRRFLRNQEFQSTKNDEEWDAILESGGQPSSDESEQPDEGNSVERQLISEALDSLTEREQLIIRTTFQYYRIGKTFQRVPNSVCQDLADQLATTSENLRKIRERALEKIKEYIRDHQTDHL